MWRHRHKRGVAIPFSSDAGLSGLVAPHLGGGGGGEVQVKFLFFNRKVIVLVSEEVHGRFSS